MAIKLEKFKLAHTLKTNYLPLWFNCKDLEWKEGTEKKVVELSLMFSEICTTEDEWPSLTYFLVHKKMKATLQQISYIKLMPNGVLQT